MSNIELADMLKRLREQADRYSKMHIVNPFFQSVVDPIPDYPIPERRKAREALVREGVEVSARLRNANHEVPSILRCLNQLSPSHEFPECWADFIRDVRAKELELRETSSDDDDWRTGAYINKHFNILPETLNKAAQRGHINMEKRGGGNLNYYFMPDVRKKWPEIVNETKRD